MKQQKAFLTYDVSVLFRSAPRLCNDQDLNDVERFLVSNNDLSNLEDNCTISETASVHK